MVLKLNDKDFLRIRGACGLAIEVVDGRVWITEEGRPADRFLSAGARYLVRGNGMVLVGAEAGATEVRLTG